MELDLILNGAVESGMKWVCFTGGEPLLQREAEKLVHLLTDQGINVLIETGGSIPVKPFTKFDHAFIDMDVKTPSSGEENTLYTDNLFYLRAQDYVKFVISDQKDYEYSKAFLTKVPDNIQIIFHRNRKVPLQYPVHPLISDPLPLTLREYNEIISLEPLPISSYAAGP